MSRGAWLLILASVALVVVALVGAAATGGSVELNASQANTPAQLDACAVFARVGRAKHSSDLPR